AMCSASPSPTGSAARSSLGGGSASSSAIWRSEILIVIVESADKRADCIVTGYDRRSNGSGRLSRCDPSVRRDGRLSHRRGRLSALAGGSVRRGDRLAGGRQLYSAHVEISVGADR